MADAIGSDDGPIGRWADGRIVAATMQAATRVPVRVRISLDLTGNWKLEAGIGQLRYCLRTFTTR